jgi:hypothetical protein
VPLERIDRVSLYVPAPVGMEVLDEVAQKQVGELWVNPGAESDALAQKAKRLGIQAIFACSIVGIGRSPEEFP